MDRFFEAYQASLNSFTGATLFVLLHVFVTMAVLYLVWAMFKRSWKIAQAGIVFCLLAQLTDATLATGKHVLLLLFPVLLMALAFTLMRVRKERQLADDPLLG